MLRFYCLSLFCFFCSFVYAQQPVLQWAKHLGTSNASNVGTNNGRSIAVDAQGNVYSAGVFFNTLDFDPGPGVYNLTTPGQGIYISKLTSSGDFVWAKQLPLGVTGPIYFNIDAQANVYITAYIGGPADMDPGPGVYIPPMVGPQDAFLLKLDTDGNFVWEKQFGGAGTNNAASGYAVEIDRNGDVLLCGSFYGTVDFDPGPSTSLLTGTSTSTVFIVKLTAAGNFQWARKLGSAGYVNAEDIKCDGGNNVYTTGWFGGTTDFDPGAGVVNLSAGGPADGFVCKLDPTGNFVWVKKIGNSVGNEVIQPRGIDIDAQNNIYTSGAYQGTQDFDPGAGVATLTSNGGADAYVLKLDALGNFIWAKSIGGIDGDQSLDVTVDLLGNPCITGIFGKQTDFDPGPGTSVVNLYDDAAVVKLDGNGNFVFAAPFKPIGSGLSAGRRLVTDAAQNVYVTGSFGGMIDFDPGPASFILTSSGNSQGIFVAKLAKCLNPTSASITINSCQAYTLNGQTYGSSGTYTQIIPNAAGCDSIITLQLSINQKQTQQSIAICEGNSFFVGGANQIISGIYTDTLQTTLGCDSIVKTTLTVHAKPKPDLGQDRTLCNDSSLVLTPGTFATYSWHDLTSQSSFTVNTSGTFWVTVTDQNSCSAADTIVISAAPTPSSFLKPVDSICSYGTLTLEPVTNYRSYLWSTGSTQSNITISAAGNYWVTVSNEFGCHGTDTITILPRQCMKGFFMPTAFTPNGDRRNDDFRALLFGNVKKYRLTIYNRWGQIIFSTTEQMKGWDGTLGGTPLRSDVFVWVCRYQFEGEGEKMEKGTVTLIR
ncbi:MAG TPA: T9SS type B sorting domain-containing protein [Flavisolibacter sp.]|nr:T9SS type B sorting domain-containing protein [Flavisolibacter sp.]